MTRALALALARAFELPANQEPSIQCVAEPNVGSEAIPPPHGHAHASAVPATLSGLLAGPRAQPSRAPWMRGRGEYSA